jgi:hypothetical protein
MAVTTLAEVHYDKEQLAKEAAGTLVRPEDSADNRAHEMQRLLLQRLGTELGQRLIFEQSTYSARVETIVSSLSRLAGPVGLVGLVGALIWMIL